MDIHKPKPVRNWREFFSEICVIVIGIAIALTGEQAVEAWHWAERVHDSEAGMNAELSQNNQDAYYRLAVGMCAKQDLDRIEALLVASRDHDIPVPVVRPYRRPLRPWQSDAWEIARSLQITGHISNKRLTEYSQAYFFPAILRASQPREREAISELNTLSINAGRLQPSERDRLFLALTKARASEREMALGAWLTIQRTRVVGLQLSSAEQQVQLAMAREDFGACVAKPNLAMPPQ